MHPLIPDDYTFSSLDDDGVLQERTLRGDRRTRRPRAPRRDADDRRLLLVRAHRTRARSSSTTSRGPSSTSSGPTGRDRPGRDRRHPHARARRPALQPVPPALPPEAGPVVRGHDRQPGVGRGARARSTATSSGSTTWSGCTRSRSRAGFGFSDTAFRVFILMASRRLKSDRFFTRDYRPEVYTQAGIDWVEYNTMRTRAAPPLSRARSRRSRESRTPSHRGGRSQGVRREDGARLTVVTTPASRSPAVRMFNGGASLVAPRMFAQRLGRRRRRRRLRRPRRAHVRHPHDPDRLDLLSPRPGLRTARPEVLPHDPRLRHDLGRLRRVVEGQLPARPPCSRPASPPSTSSWRRSRARRLRQP